MRVAPPYERVVAAPLAPASPAWVPERACSAEPEAAVPVEALSGLAAEELSQVSPLVVPPAGCVGQEPGAIPALGAQQAGAFQGAREPARRGEVVGCRAARVGLGQPACWPADDMALRPLLPALLRAR